MTADESTPSWSHTGYAQRIHFGVGALDRLPEAMKETGARRWLLVTTEGRLASEDGARLVGLLGRSCTSTFAEVRSHVPTTAVEAAVLQARRDGVDGVVSFGGGSCADLAKAVCYFVEQSSGTPGASYVDRPAVAHVAVPTTYSGAELTPFFGMTDEAARAKSGAGGPTIAPLAAVYDPALTLSTPGRVSAETGMNAIAHGVEVAYSSARTPEAEAVGLACVAQGADALPRVVADPSDLAARSDMLAAAALGGRSLANATMGVHHGLSQLVGGRTGVAHGLVNAVILPHAMAFNVEVVPGPMRRIGAALGDAGDAPGAAARLVERLGLPTRLGECGVSEEDLDAVARLSSRSPGVRANPRPVSEADARAILQAAY
ncbi:MAG: iron-containing alcohol dehydrogenase [Actinomycetota bacterium]|nr:iron-containing alcohol dehydrogenase [Actinomycetota bacterium]